MNAERWQQVKTLLEDAREHPRGDGRRAWLAGACAGDAELLGEVESFLAHEERLEGFIEEPVLSVIAGEADRLDARAAGRKVGHYRLVRLLGTGGMGAVYLAEREEDFEQRVALKLVRRGLADGETIRRFESERQILARLEHPNIARLLDGGTTADGVPYLVMELVDGEPIDRACDRQRLGVRARLELCLEVCSALDLAHQSLVVHRDLKPGNILIDAAGRPKLLDFGIAKLLEPSGRAATTAGHGHAMTLRYASPEQLQGLPVGTASDVYSLGVVLYQLLTGRLPCGLEGRSHLDLMRAVCEEDPALPSAVVERDEEVSLEGGEVLRFDAEELSRARGSDPRRLRRRLRGDVDGIVLKALRKDPRDRYASIERLAADIRRYLDGLPVLAREGNLAYRARKFVGRHRLGLASAAVIVLLAAVFTTAQVRQLRETERQRDRVERSWTFLVELFQAADPGRPGGGEPTVRELLDRGRRNLEAGLEDEPEVRATLLFKLGEVYYKLAHFSEAAALLGEAVALLRRQNGADPSDLAAAINGLAGAYHGLGELDRARALYEESLAMRRRLGSEDDLSKPMNSLAASLLERGRADEAAAMYRQSLDRRRALLAATPVTGEDYAIRRANVATSLRSLATALFAAGDLAGAEPLLREALAIRREVFGPASPKVALVLVSLGRLEHGLGRLDEAEALVAEALEIRRRKLGDDHWHTASAKKDLAAILLDAGDGDAARVLLAQALETLYRVRPPGDRSVAESESILGNLLFMEKRFDEAEVCLRGAARTLEERRGPDDASSRAARSRLAAFLEASDREG